MDEQQLTIAAMFNIELLSDRTVNYAMQQNDVPVIKMLRINNASADPMRDLCVRITAEPAFAAVKELPLTAIGAGETYSLGSVDLQLSHDYLATLTERVVGALHIELLKDGECLAHHSQRIEVLAYDEWNGLQSLPEIIAAFVTPNHPAVEAILSDAATLLGQWTGDSSLSGYQSHDRQRVATMVDAIFVTLQQRQLRYCNPPASFEDSGQKLRLPDRLLDTRLGTCLDLAVFMASCLEQAGLSPLIIFTEGHAFAGVWLDDDCFPDIATDDMLRVRKRTEVGEICVFETTLLTSDTPVPFDQAVKEGSRHLHYPEKFRCAIDICRSRKSQIRPLPIRAADQGLRPVQAPAATFDPLAAPSTIAIPGLGIATAAGDQAVIETPETRLEGWKRKLLDLSLRNRLINFRHSKKTLPILCPDLGSLEDALAVGSGFKIFGPLPRLWEADDRSDDVHRQRTGEDAYAEQLRDEFHAKRLHADVPEGEVNRRLLEIYREAKTVMEESGANTLYLALGFLAWYETKSSAQPRRAPIIMIPMEIDRHSVQEGFSIKQGDDEPMVNVTLLEMLAKDFGLHIPNMDPIPADEKGIDVQGILHAFRQAIVAIDRWEVIEDACIGHFSFTKFLMWRDLEVRADDLQRNKVVSHLINTPNRPYADDGGFPDRDRLDETHNPAETFCPLSSDSSQLAAVYAAALGKSFVLHGPPGTGKSQTIVNLIAHTLATGKTVLFVSEKRAALEVVHKRLVECGLDPFCLELHSNKSHKLEVLQQLGAALDYSGAHSSAEWLHEAQRLAAARRELNAYVAALHEERDIGMSVYQGFTRLIGLRDITRIHFDLLGSRKVDRLTFDRMRDAVGRLHMAAEAIVHPTRNVWATTQYTEWTPTLERDILACLRRVDACCRALADAALPAAPMLGLDSGDWSQETFALASRAASIVLERLPAMTPELLRTPDWTGLRGTIATWVKAGRRRDQIRVDVFQRFSASLLSLDIEAMTAKITRAQASWLTPELIGHRAATAPEAGGASLDWIGWVETEVFSAMQRLQQCSQRLITDAQQVAPYLGITVNQQPLAAYRFLDTLSGVLVEVPEALPTNLLTEADWETVRLTIREWIDHGRRRASLRKTLFARYTEQLLTLNLDELQQKLTIANGSWVVARAFGHWSVKRVVKRVSRVIPLVSIDEIGADLNAAIALRAEEQYFAHLQGQATAFLGLYWKDHETDWDAVERLLDWCGSLRTMIAVAVNSDSQKATELRARLAAFLRENRDRCVPAGDIGQLFLALRDGLTEFNQSYQSLASLLPLDLATVWGDDKIAKPDTIITCLQGWMEQIAALSQLRSTANLAHLTPLAHLQQDLALGQELKTLIETIAACRDRATAVLEDYWQDGEADWGHIDELLDHADHLRVLARELAGSQPERSLAILQTWATFIEGGHDQLAQHGRIGSALTQFVQSHADVDDALIALHRALMLPTQMWGDPATPDFLNRVQGHTQRWTDHLGSFKAWCYWYDARRDVIDLGLQALVSAYEAGSVTPNDFVRTFERGFYQEWVETTIARVPVLRSFFSREFERKIQQFREMDDRYLKLTRAEIAARIAAKMPRSTGIETPTSEMGILRRQTRLQRRHLPVRSLFQKIPNLLPRLKPCLLMSPISVAQYLDPAHPPFDLVVFDEASQIPVWDAIGAIARGSEAIIVGDPKQLPPTSFFARVDGDDEDEVDDDTVKDLQSILDDCLAAQLPPMHLRWHYRSRHESLITFSNFHYYENNLLTFPSPHQQPAVTLRHVDGLYDKGKSRTNRAEAEAVVHEIITRLEDPSRSHDSIGVVTFNLAQQRLIEDLLEEARLQHPEIERYFAGSADDIEPVFVKNLENVQGDERDVILFSICYGPDAQGRVSLNFGPLNRDGGERRLNVAVTRARKEALVFSTVRAEQIDLTKTRSRGVADLKTFLEYAERGPIAIAARRQCDPEAECESPFEQEVYDALCSKGYKVHPQVGCSGYRIDLAVVDPDEPGRYLLGIECDGANYHRAKTARDRDRLRESVLRDLGWQLHRIWSTDWWEKPKHEVERMEMAIDEARKRRTTLASMPTQRPQRVAAQPMPEAPVLPAPTRVVSQPRPQEQVRAIPVYETYPVQQTLGSLDDFYQFHSDDLIKRILESVVTHEGPVSFNIAARRVAAHWGIKRVTDNIASRMRLLFSTGEINVNEHRADEVVFLWPPDMTPEGYTAFRVPGNDPHSRRDASDLPPEEIANAALYVLQQQVSLPMEDLVRETARLFGFQRTGINVEKLIRAGVERLFARGKAIVQDGMVVHQHR